MVDGRFGDESAHELLEAARAVVNAHLAKKQGLPCAGRAAQGGLLSGGGLQGCFHSAITKQFAMCTCRTAQVGVFSGGGLLRDSECLRVAREGWGSGGQEGSGSFKQRTSRANNARAANATVPMFMGNEDTSAINGCCDVYARGHSRRRRLGTWRRAGTRRTWAS